jgi:hypothetical protein
MPPLRMRLGCALRLRVSLARGPPLLRCVRDAVLR